MYNRYSVLARIDSKKAKAKERNRKKNSKKTRDT